MNYLLEDITVIDAASFLAGPAAATIMADYGANVIKIEPPGGDGYRNLAGAYPVPYHWQLTSRNKRSLALDLGMPEGRAVLHRLIEKADVLTTNFLDSALKKYEMEYEQLKTINPRLIFAHISGYGLKGPDVERRAFDITGWWARSGMMELVRDPGQMPLGAAPGMGDHATATALYGAIMTALYRREKTGEGGFVSTSLLANGAWSNGMALQGTIAGVDLAANRQKPGSSLPFSSCYQCADGRFVVLAAINMAKEWPRLCRAINRTEWLNDPERADFRYAIRNRVAAIEEIQAAFEQFDRDEVTTRLDAEGVTHGVVPTMGEVIDDEQLRANDIIIETGVKGDDYSLTVNSPIDLEGEDKRPPSRAPEIGAQSEEVLLEFGFTKDEVSQLLTRQAVRQHLPDEGFRQK